MNAFDPNRFWPNGDADSREWWYMEGADRQEWREACREAYKRNPREYADPESILVLVSHEEASGAPIYGPGAGYGLAPTWSPVRGTDYVAASTWDIPAGEARAIIVDLVPTPDNPHDPTAVAVEYEGVKLGNLSRGYAAYAHWKFRQLNYQGLRVRTAAAYRAFYRPGIRLATPEAFVALPTLPGLDRYMPSMEEQSLGFRRLWEALDVSLQDEIRDDWYHLSEEAAQKLIRYSPAFPELTLPTQASSDLPKAFDVAMQTVRLEEAAARAAEKEAAKAAERESIKVLATERLTRAEIAEELQIPRGRVDRIVKELGIAADVEVRQASRISDERKQEVLQRAMRGESNAQIEREVKLGKGRAAKILSESGISRGPIA
ncbi:HIRAN domain-containing protein [Microbacterium sp. zg.Y625]|uniref:HIRAN domain-containing protein n=1 Tax=Microbacterium jiangjiandongii TaxID=3049071 RepID=UPI00214C8747|nr:MULTISPECIES: HIRAN domain-containing protein [unclassified Microbacterium]MCR2791702.1 HIRAN domain-containing protein [Microbacterium sp. zg.Y625]WIM24520.1 HIRAN domain-containing protein [Microbacterium sp. zg-Y625]